MVVWRTCSPLEPISAGATKTCSRQQKRTPDLGVAEGGEEDRVQVVAPASDPAEASLERSSPSIREAPIEHQRRRLVGYRAS